MPQTSPMSWILLSNYVIIFMFLNSSIFFNELMVLNVKSYFILLKTKNWMW